jgi:phosphoribosylamine---glycine ligase
MNVLIVGSGGREHAVAWKAAQSPRLTNLFVAPGNAGTSTLAENVPIPAEDTSALVAFARDRAIDLVLVGPEGPLANGLTDALRAAQVRVFGPSQAAAQIEASKSYSKQFMARHGIPSARYVVFRDFYDALRHLLMIDYPVVIKASGLAAGKGVIVPDCADDAEAALRRIMQERCFGAAGDEVVIEERLSGPEISLMAFTDGITVSAMPPAQDHKRLCDGDQGPNTGGMGAYAPAPICRPALAAELTRTVLQRAVDGMRAEGNPLSGVLYAGLILTAGGPRVLEFNCRFGDPETQVVIPLLDDDLLDIAEACGTGRLGEVSVHWKNGAAACVVLASEGYPGPYTTGRTITGLDRVSSDTLVFHAGTKRAGEQIVSVGGRVMGVVGVELGDSLAYVGRSGKERDVEADGDNGYETDKLMGADARVAVGNGMDVAADVDNGNDTDKRIGSDALIRAVDTAYRAIEQIKFEGMQFRRDIGLHMHVRPGRSSRVD